ncbi:MAG: BBP7 family outer membrane beta-barrel protein [Aeoliella sp.]
MTRFFFTAHGIAAAVVFSFAGASLAAPTGQGNYVQSPQAYQALSGYAPQAYTQQPRYAAVPHAAAQQGLPNYASYPAVNYRAPAPQARYAMQDNDAPTHVPQPESVPKPAANGHATPVAPANGGNYATGDYGCDTGVPGANNWNGYVQTPAAAAGCNTGGYGAYGCDTGTCDYGTFGGGAIGNGLLGGRQSNRQWFFGVYGLYMSRDNPGYEKIAVLVDSPAAYPYYPTQAETFLSTSDLDTDFQWGAEIRFGSTFGRAGGRNSCDQGYGCDTGCNTQCGPQPYAWEVVYWGLSEDDQWAVRTDALADTDRIYGSMNFAGIEYDRDGAGGTYVYRPLNDYFDYQMPIDDPALDPTAIRVVGVRVRNNFKAQNLELNFIRFPLAGCQPCDPCGAPRFTVNGVCGVRYMKLDEDLQIAAQFSDPTVVGDPIDYTGSFPSGDDTNLFYDISTDNEMVGFQFGSNMNWLIGCKWSAFCDTQLGIFGNKISNSHRFWSGAGGEARFVGTGDSANVRSSKTDVSFLGEVRAGMGYQVGCNCRWTTAYRVMAISGVALSGEQLKNDYANSEYVGIIDSNDSIVLHGVQTGLEWKY